MLQDSFTDYYGILGVEKSASFLEVRKAIERKMADIKEAQAVLLDEGKRKEYDARYDRNRRNKEGSWPSLASTKQVKYARFLLYSYGEDVYDEDELTEIWREMDPSHLPSRERVSEIIEELKEEEDGEEF